MIMMIKLSSTHDNFYNVSLCSIDSCPYPSICVSETICQCEEGYYDIKELNGEKKDRCSYKQKSNKAPFWLEIILNLGFGHIYIGYYHIFFLKFLYISFTLGFFYYVCMSDKNSRQHVVDSFQYIISILNLLFCLGVLIWWLIDTICFFFNIYKDNNGVKLSSK